MTLCIYSNFDEYIKVMVLVLNYFPQKKYWHCSTKLKSSTGTGNGTAKLGKYWYWY
jgi:hypothetical protein